MVEEKRSGSSFKDTLHVWYYRNDRSKEEFFETKHIILSNFGVITLATL